MIYCRKCGKELADTAQFCSDCGAQQGDAEDWHRLGKKILLQRRRAAKLRKCPSVHSSSGGKKPFFLDLLLSIESLAAAVSVFSRCSNTNRP